MSGPIIEHSPVLDRPLRSQEEVAFNEAIAALRHLAVHVDESWVGPYITGRLARIEALLQGRPLMQSEGSK